MKHSRIAAAEDNLVKPVFWQTKCYLLFCLDTTGGSNFTFSIIGGGGGDTINFVSNQTTAWMDWCLPSVINVCNDFIKG
jgi:hypothetical protein